MGKKVSPISFRLGITKDWVSRWFKVKDVSKFLEEDLRLRQYILNKLKSGAIKDVIIERDENSLRIKILAGRPGVVIGRSGAGIEELKNGIKGLIMSFRSKKKIRLNKLNIEIEVEEVKNFEENASLVAQSVVEQLEKRIPFRRVLKSTLDAVEKQKNVKGVKIMIAGRLNGAEMSRREWVAHGEIPLHTIRADIDFAKANAYTTYGVLGVKVWIYKGQIFSKQVRSLR